MGQASGPGRTFGRDAHFTPRATRSVSGGMSSIHVMSRNGEHKNGEPLHVVGKPFRKVDARAKCTGQTKFADDILLPRMLYCKVLRSHLPHALIKHIDLSKARSLPGVIAVITGKDLPIPYGILPVSQDEHALCIDKVRFIGDPVAAVAAIDEDVAFDAMNLIEVAYAPLQTISSIEEGVMIDEPRIHEYGDGGNVHKKVSLEFGETDEGFAEADLIREDTFFYEGNTHLPMEQHAAVAYYDTDEKLTLWSSTQTPHYVHRALTKVLEIAASHIRVIATPNGGGFGGKSDPFNHEVIVCKLSMITGRPVKCTLTREEVFYCHRGRHPVLMNVKTGVKKDGAITANYLRIGSMGLGTCIDKVVEGSDWKNKFSGWHVSEPRAVATGSFDFRFRNSDLGSEKFANPQSAIRNPQFSDPLATARGSETAHGPDARKLPYGKGIGFACSSYICGAGLPIYWNNMPQSGVQLRLDRQGGVCVMCGSTDIGQGSDSILAYIVAEVLGIDPFDIRIVTADTDLTPVDLGSYSSRVTLMTGNAAIQAAERARELLVMATAEKLGVAIENITLAERRVFDVENPDVGVSFAEAVVLAESKFGTIGTVGSYTPPRSPGKYKGAGVGPSPAYSYSAAGAEVDVDPDTGIVLVERIWIAHDIGKSINPMLVMGQVEGSVYMGLGEILMEEMAYRGNRNVVHKFPSMLEYKSPTTMEMCDVKTYLIEDPDPNGPFGAKEVGQGPLLPVPPAVANAVYNAVGVRIDEIPITPEKVLKALREKSKGRDARFGPDSIPTIEWPEPLRVLTPSEGGDGREMPRVAVHS